LKGTGKYFKEAEAKYNVNAVFLASIAIIESGNARFKAAKMKNNFFGLMGRKGLKSFSSPKECIMYVAKIISNPKGHYYGKKRYTISGIGRKYASSKKWPSVISKTMKTIK
jgi:beta-N-acetylglucosaminidase